MSHGLTIVTWFCVMAVVKVAKRDVTAVRSLDSCILPIENSRPGICDITGIKSQNVFKYCNIYQYHFVAISLWIWNGDTSNRNCEQSQVELEEASQLKLKYVQLFKAFGITGSFGSVDGIVEILLSSLCILFIWSVFFKHQHFWSLWLIFQSSVLVDDREQVFFITTREIRYLYRNCKKKQHLRNLQPLSW